MPADGEGRSAGAGTRTRWGVITAGHDARYFKGRDRHGRPILIARDLGHALSPKGANLRWMQRQFAELQALLRRAGKDAHAAERYWSRHPTAIRGRIEAELRAGARGQRPPAASDRDDVPSPVAIPSWLRTLLTGRRAATPAATAAPAATGVPAPAPRRVRPGALARLSQPQRASLRRVIEGAGGDFATWRRQVLRNAVGAPAGRPARIRPPRVGRAS